MIAPYRRAGPVLTAVLWILASASGSAAAAPATDSVAGSYRLHGGPDVASELILRPDGKFEYFLMAGALDEQAQGSWRVDGGTLRLETLPKPVAAVFSAGPQKPGGQGKLDLHTTSPTGHGIALVHFTLGFDRGPPVTDYTQDYGWSLDPAEPRTPLWIELSVPMYNLRSQRFPIDLAAGNDVTFILTPNDLGTIDFTGMQIDIQPHRLVMHRDGALIPFEQTQPNGE
ncbi:MAG: hypothetical protein ABI626_08595 [Sphingomicrobium sp.]